MLPNIASNTLINIKGIEDAGSKSCDTESKLLKMEWNTILYMFAHDMKNPVITAGGFLSRLFSGRIGSLTETQLAYLELIKDNLSKVENLVTHLLDFLTFKAKEYNLVLSPVNLLSTLSKNIEILRMESDKKDIKILFDHPDKIPSVINADAMLIHRVITNLLDNAIRHTNPGGTITVRLSDRDEAALVQITDTGIGIPENHLPHIFDAFYRVNRDSAGSGIGLFIVKSIIEAHGGEIRVESIPDKGSSFSFTLPKEIEEKGIFINC
jgi:two-component system, OmpR family, phosphate regulon sensor histidine kinase PhoR